MQNFPDYDFLMSEAKGMVTIPFEQYLNNGTINQEQYDTLKEENRKSVAFFQDMFNLPEQG